MKKTVCLLLVFCLMLPMLFGCGSKMSYDYDLEEYVDVGNVYGVKAVFSDPLVVTDEEVDNALFQVMLTYADFEAKEGKAERYNKILLVYDILSGGQILEDYHEESYEIVIGSDSFGDLDYRLGEAFLGASVGETREVKHTFPENDASLGAWAGATVTAQGTLTAVFSHNVSECTDEFAQSIEGYAFETVGDFRAHLGEEVRLQKENAKRKAVHDAFFASAQVKQYPEKEVEGLFESYKKDAVDMAKDLDITYEAYLKEYLQTDVETFETAAREEAKKKVRTDLICLRAIELMGLELSEEEYEEGLSSLYESSASYKEAYESAEELEKALTKGEIRRSLLWDKTFDRIVQEAVMLEEGYENQ